MPVYSMTGYASAQHSTATTAPEGESRTQPVTQLGLEVRSVNSRFLDLTFRLPEDLRQWATELAQRISHASANADGWYLYSLCNLPCKRRRNSLKHNSKCACRFNGAWIVGISATDISGGRDTAACRTACGMAGVCGRLRGR